MFDTMIVAAIGFAIFASSAYFVYQSGTCVCPNINPYVRPYLLGFSGVAMVYEVLLFVLGTTLVDLLLKSPALLALFVALAIGGLVWAILTIQYATALKECKCADSVAEEVAYWAAVIEVSAWALVVLLLGYAGVMYSGMSVADRKAMLAAVMSKKGA